MALEVYSATGQRVRQLMRGRVRAGEFEAAWDGRDERGWWVASGVYYYKLQVGERRVVKKMLFLK